MGCNMCATLDVGMVVACEKLGLTSVRAYVGPSDRLAQHEAQHKQNKLEKVLLFLNPSVKSRTTQTK